MKRNFLNIILIVFMIFFVGCSVSDNVKTYAIDLSLINEETYIDEFDITAIRIKETDLQGNVNYINANESMFDYQDYVKLQSAGTHTITLKYKFFQESFTITLIEKESSVLSYFSTDDLYYISANGLNKEDLKLSLRSIISVVIKIETYDDLRVDLALTDADPNNSSNIILMYTGYSVSNKWDGGNTWNREHVWPQSLGWFKTTGAGADLHHIKPTNPSENSSRGNKLYGSTTNSKYYEPRDEVKGDIARIIFYLMVRYEEADNYTFKTVAESKELLLSWNELDPVDNFEKNRNEVAYSIQGNRNPFIDHPECANLIWG